MWELFVVNRMWVLVAGIVSFIVAYSVKERIARATEKAVAKRWHTRAKVARKIVGWIIIGTAGGLLSLAIAAFIIKYYGMDIQPFLKAVRSWLRVHSIPIAIIAVPAYAAYRVVRATLPLMIGRFVAIRGKRRETKERMTKRTQTLGAVLTATIGVIIAIVATFMILAEIGINITPLLAGAGIAGIAIGFGAQSMVKDLISGFFIIIENQYDVGDVIKVNNQIAGGVEGLNLRRTSLRDLDGILHIIPNGEIRMASNLTKLWSRVHLDIGVAYKEDLDRVMAVIKRTWEELAEDPDWGPLLISKTPWLLRVDEFGDSGIIIKVVGESEPGQHWNLMGELRRRIKRVFDEEGIEIPWPHVKLYFGESKTSGGPTCKACSQVNPPGSSFCSNCGASLGSQ